MFKCHRCKNEIKQGGSIITLMVDDPFVKTYISSDGRVELCETCAMEFVDWMKNSQSNKVGPMEQVAKRENPKHIKLGPVEQVAKREDGK